MYKRQLIKDYVKDCELTASQKIRHELTHRSLDLNLNVYLSSKESEIETNQQYRWIKKDRIGDYGLPKPISQIINDL